ncbi:MAG: alpha/beta fold hydrolase [Mycobacteriales bacterium]
MDITERGRRTYAYMMGGNVEEEQANLRRRAPELYDALVEGGFGSIISDPSLTGRDREIATVAMLAAEGGAEPQLARHIAAALGIGVEPSELLAMCGHVAGYAGFPRGLNALTVIERVVAEAGLPSPAAQRRVRLADHETLLAQRGESGPVVVLAHALGLDWRMWDTVMPALAAAGRRVVAYDLRGHGWAAGSPSPHTMDDAARDLIGVIDALGVETAHVVGLSYGGGIAQQAAVAHPERFASLSLLATTDHPFEAFEGRARSGEVDGMAAQVVPSLTRWFTPEGLAVGGWGVRYARERVLRGNPVDWAASWRAFKGLDVRDKLGGLTVPTLVLAGERDASTTPEIMSALADRVPGARYQVLPGTPHMQTLECPELVAEALDAFLPAENR